MEELTLADLNLGRTIDCLSSASMAVKNVLAPTMCRGSLEGCNVELETR